MKSIVLLLQEAVQAVQRTAPAGGRPLGLPIPLHGPSRPPPGFSFVDMLRELIQFVGYFLAIGAVGFRFGIVRRIRGMTDEARNVLRADNAAVLGMLGVFLVLLSFVGGPYLESFTRKVSLYEVLSNNLRPFEFKLGMLTVALIGFRLVRTDRTLGWALASIGVTCSVLQPLYTESSLERLTFAALVLIATSVLVTLPSPK